ncbi:MAG: nucleoside hydrolase [Eubacteriales bacterium]|nr:nucleoside hydrolase [Eubacteriales bacterium]
MKWLLDCDPGVDDFLALNLLAPSSAYRDFEADCLAYVSVNGNCDVETASSNLALADRLFQLSAPIYQGRALPLNKEVRHGFFHGKDGLLGQAQALAELAPAKTASEYPDLVSRRR